LFWARVESLKLRDNNTSGKQRNTEALELPDRLIGLCRLFFSAFCLALWTVFFLIGAMAEGEPRGNSGPRLLVPNLDHVGRCEFSSTASTNTAPVPMERWSSSLSNKLKSSWCQSLEKQSEAAESVQWGKQLLPFFAMSIYQKQQTREDDATTSTGMWVHPEPHWN
jgi:hypothetical protein